MGVEGFDGKLDDVGISGSGDIDAASRENRSFVVVDLDIHQTSRFAACDEYARTVLSLDGGDAVGVEAAADEAGLFFWDRQFRCRQHQVVFNQ